MKEQALLDCSSQWSSPSFDDAKHNILCSELKQLYVAITRMRQRLWICENALDFSKPMFDYWKKKCLIQVRLVDHALAEAMQVSSVPEEWKSQGFKEASDLEGKALEIYEAIGVVDSAAECFYMLKEYERAGRIYMEKCGESTLEKAGDCFSLARRYSLAAEADARGSIFSNLEEDFGNFSVAAKIARMKGDILHEADRLGKSGQNKEASYEYPVVRVILFPLGSWKQRVALEAVCTKGGAGSKSQTSRKA
ncbi:hypothetical protein NL676_038075 [Syzygium grande]|nr:hypothetical protein NL676_038075 [Syzygium grande]